MFVVVVVGSCWATEIRGQLGAKWNGKSMISPFLGQKVEKQNHFQPKFGPKVE